MNEPTTATTVGRVLLSRNFWPYFAGNLLSNSGTWFQSIAQVLLVYRLTGSSLWVGVVNFSQFAAVLVLAPLAGSAADRYDRGRIVVGAQLLATGLAGSLALVTAADAATVPVVIGVALALGVTTALATPALHAMVPSLVSRAELPAAIALNAVTFNLSRALGPVAGVFVIARFGIPTAFAMNSLSYLALAGAMLILRPHPQEARPAGPSPRLRESFRLVRANPALFAPLLVVGVVSVTADPVNTLTPAFSTEIFGRPDTFTGVLVGAFGAGAVTAAFVVGRRFPSYASIVVTLGLLSGGIAVFALSPNELVGVAGLLAGGFGFLASVTIATSLLQLEIEDSHRGRVMALWSLSFHGARPVASLVDGALASLLTVRAAGLVMALPALGGCAVLAAAVARRKATRQAET